MKKIRKKILVYVFAGVFLSFSFFCKVGAQSMVDASSDFYQHLNDLSIPIWQILSKKTLSRYDFTRLLSAVECEDCVTPTIETRTKYNSDFWDQFLSSEDRDFGDVKYPNTDYQWTNYFYCIARVADWEIMRGYPLATSPVCWWKFCWERNVSKAEFFQTITNILADKEMGNYVAPWKEIKDWLKKQNKNSYTYKMFTSTELDTISSMAWEDKSISSKSEFTAYLKYCMFNLDNCWFEPLWQLNQWVWPIAEANFLLNEWIISEEDVVDLGSSITPQDAFEKIDTMYVLYTKCNFDSDYDCDWIPNHEDNCAYQYNPSQTDLDSDYVWDVCDDDIDGDWKTNPIWIVDDTWNINYSVLKNGKLSDNSPFWEQLNDVSYFINVNSLNQWFPATAVFEVIWQEAPASVEWDFWDLSTGKWTKVQHSYSQQWYVTVVARVTTKKWQKQVISNQIFIWETNDSTYGLNIKINSIDSKSWIASFQPDYQWNFDYFVWVNTANNTQKEIKGDAAFVTKLETGKRNNITVKGYSNGQLVAVASTDILDQNWTFFWFVPTYTPQLKSVGTKMTTTIRLNGISVSSIKNVKWDFWDGTTRIDKNLVSNYTYNEWGLKALIQKIELNNWKELIASSTISVKNVSKLWNQAFNISSNTNTVWRFDLTLLPIWFAKSDVSKIVTSINWTPVYSHAGLTNINAFYSVQNKQGIVRVKTQVQEWSIHLANEGFLYFWLKNKDWINVNTNLKQIFSWYRCDLDKDGIPDAFDNDIDGDWVQNLLWMISFETENCEFIVWDNVDEDLYKQHFWVCSLDNCPFISNWNQNDLNNNWVWDVCEWATTCWNKQVDAWEDCKNCPQDIWECVAFCWNNKIEKWETCTNCPQDVKVCLEETCGNKKIDEWEECDNWDNNWKDKKCTEMCTKYDSKNPLCWNGKVDEWEDCNNCPIDLQDVCVDDWKNLPPVCWNWVIELWETCKTCEEDVGPCTAFCWNNEIEKWETCTNCPHDVKVCLEETCGNKRLDDWEECDNWTNNWKDWMCSVLCTMIDPSKPLCWNGRIDAWEDCTNCPEDVKSACIDDADVEINLCWNNEIDGWETCKTCPQDVRKCTAFCGNDTIEKWETCTNCPEDVKVCLEKTCGNKKIDEWEECDNWANNWRDWKCSVLCTIIDPNKPLCWNGIVDKWEDCSNCPQDLQDACVDIWEKVGPVCWNGKIESGETCKTCEEDVGPCVAFCGNNIIEKWETCKNCPKDVKVCIERTCWNKKIDKWEECDNWTNNWKDKKCTILCTNYDPKKPLCWNWRIDEWEDCTNCPEDVKWPCVDIWDYEPVCWNKKIESGENCETCPEDVGTCTAICWNGVVDPWETCLNCPKDVTVCLEVSCWNNVIDPGETCTNCPKDVGVCSELCGNKRIDDWETCKTCPKDVGPCTASCGNGTVEDAETCENCPEDVGECSLCWNGRINVGEECDDWNNNWKDWKCTKQCEKIPTTCWNSKIDDWENCRNCPWDVGICTAYCGNGKIDDWETCKNCPKDVEKCYEQNCWNDIVEGLEQCDNWKKNGTDKICTLLCTKYNPWQPLCWNGKIDDWETCKTCAIDLKDLCITDDDKPKCWNGIIDPWETCKTCSKDVGECTAYCWNGKIEKAEDCHNCPEDVWKCTASCGNGIVEEAETCKNCSKDVPICVESKCWDGKHDIHLWEDCDSGSENWKDNFCSVHCKFINPKNPLCWNGKIDDWEKCDNCSEDLTDRCVDNWEKPICGNGKIEEGETCKTCPEDVKSCTAFCWNGEIEAGETCYNCPKDVGKCIEKTCWNGKTDTDAWEECDDWDKNGKNWVCSLVCLKIDKNNRKCWNGKIDEWEDCSNCSKDLKDLCVDDWSKVDPKCWNGIIDSPDENCDNCSEDLKDICVDDWDSEVPTCWNGEIDEWETCQNCSKDLKDLCLDIWEDPECPNGVVNEWETCQNCADDLWSLCIGWNEEIPTCWNKVVDPWETCSNCPEDVPVCDQDWDGCSDVLDSCPFLAGEDWECCPTIPSWCEWDDCVLVKAVCNSCPCQFADFTNTLQRNDQVRARLWDKGRGAQYWYSAFYSMLYMDTQWGED